MSRPPYIKEPSIKFTTGSFCDGTWVMTEEERRAHRFFAPSVDDRTPEQKAGDEFEKAPEKGSNP
ncbi:MAG: hypothetical protein WAX66_03680 [Patescibacteria group bacterium]